MNIVYISSIGADIAIGLTWSVPASIRAQKKYDNVLWINISDRVMDHWLDTGVYQKTPETGCRLDLNNLPDPFKKPDVVVFEGFYFLKTVFFSWKLRKAGIPYVIIPRGSLTQKAFHNHSWSNFIKKKIACWLFFNSYTKNALAVQFLTEQEFLDSGNKWTNNPIIIPNGFDSPKQKKVGFSNNGLEIVFIGRPAIYHKGLDLLIDACSMMKQELIEKHIHISLHVPQKDDYTKLVSMLESADIADVITLKPAITGEEKEKCLLDSDLFIMTSRFEGHPMGLVEALAYGLPVIVTPGSNMSREIEEYDAGWVCNSSVEDICQSLRDVYEKRYLLKSKSENALKLSEKYRWDSLAKDFHNKIQAMLC